PLEPLARLRLGRLTRHATRAAAVALCSVVVVSGCGGGKPKQHPYVVIARKSAAGKHADATASAVDSVFSGHEVRVVAAPRQRVKANWSFTCTSADGILSRDADDFGGQTPLTAPARPVTVSR